LLNELPCVDAPAFVHSVSNAAAATAAAAAAAAHDR